MHCAHGHNISYVVIGDKFGCWNFFPPGEGWGVIAAWGSAVVGESKHMLDSSAHRAALPPGYNSYARIRGEAHFDSSIDDELMWLFPLYAM